MLQASPFITEYKNVPIYTVVNGIAESLPAATDILYI